MAFFQDPARQPFLRVPPAVIWLIALFLGIHGLLTTVFAAHANDIYASYGFIPARYSQIDAAGTGAVLKQIYRFVSYIFLHGSWSHVIINSVWLLAFGPVVARRFGTPLFMAFFLLCGIVAATAHLAANWGSPEVVIGASGGIAGLMAAAFRMLQAEASPQVEAPLTPIFSTRILVWTAIWLLINVIAGVTGLGAGTGPNVVAWVAHMGGYFAGLLLAGPFDRLARQ
jgi:membrane associated rhomboid family serine protease